MPKIKVKSAETPEERERRIILGYDVEALKRNIEKRRKEIEVFQKEIEKAYQNIGKLQRYVEMIETEKLARKAMKKGKK